MAEKLQMPTPVTQSEESSEMVMQFYLPSKCVRKKLALFLRHHRVERE